MTLPPPTKPAQPEDWHVNDRFPGDEAQTVAGRTAESILGVIYDKWQKVSCKSLDPKKKETWGGKWGEIVSRNRFAAWRRLGNKRKPYLKEYWFFYVVRTNPLAKHGANYTNWAKERLEEYNGPRSEAFEKDLKAKKVEVEMSIHLDVTMSSVGDASFELDSELGDKTPSHEPPESKTSSATPLLSQLRTTSTSGGETPSALPPIVEEMDTTERPGGSPKQTGKPSGAEKSQEPAAGKSASWADEVDAEEAARRAKEAAQRAGGGGAAGGGGGPDPPHDSSSSDETFTEESSEGEMELTKAIKKEKARLKKEKARKSRKTSEGQSSGEDNDRMEEGEVAEKSDPDQEIWTEHVICVQRERLA